MSRKDFARNSSSPAKCPCAAKHWGWKKISGFRSGYSDPANVCTLSTTSGDMREAGATTPILHLSLLMGSAPPALHLIGDACRFRRCHDLEIALFDVPTWRLLFLRRRR